MKFLMIVLAVHFVAEMISNKVKEKAKDEETDRVIHPAEFDMRG
jgi:Na+-transporting methylmalonyl-CoA/oxaloacetate decarboxylase gamma subunit